MHFWAAGENGAHIHGERVVEGRGAVHVSPISILLFLVIPKVVCLCDIFIMNPISPNCKTFGLMTSQKLCSSWA